MSGGMVVIMGVVAEVLGGIIIARGQVIHVTFILLLIELQVFNIVLLVTGITAVLHQIIPFTAKEMMIRGRLEMVGDLVIELLVILSPTFCVFLLVIGTRVL